MENMMQKHRRSIRTLAAIIGMLLCLSLRPAFADDTWQPADEQPPRSVLYNAISLCVNDLTEHDSLSASEAYLCTINAEYGRCKKYLQGNETVWRITFTNHAAQDEYCFVLGADADWIIRIKAGDELANKDEALLVSQPGASSSVILPTLDDYYNADGQYFYHWTTEEKAAFSMTWRQWITDLVLSCQIDKEWVVGEPYYQWTRRAYGIPGADALSEEETLRQAQQTLTALGKPISSDAVCISFFDVTDTNRPQWRFYIDYRYAVIIDAHSGELLFLRDGSIREYDVAEFMMQK